jgi:hypothetical protein
LKRTQTIAVTLFWVLGLLAMNVSAFHRGIGPHDATSRLCVAEADSSGGASLEEGLSFGNAPKEGGPNFEHLAALLPDFELCAMRSMELVDRNAARIFSHLLEQSQFFVRAP